MKYPLIVFDVDGTIIDSRETIQIALRGALDQVGRRLEPEFMDEIMGLTLEAFFREAGVADIPEAVRLYREIYFRLIDTKEKVFDGMPAVLKELSRFSNLAVATNKGPEGARLSLAKHGLENLFQFIACDDGGLTKPHSGVMESILRHFDGQGIHYLPEDVLMVGDTPTDRHFAFNSGVDFCFVTWGFFPLEAISPPPQYSVERPADLLELNAVTEIIFPEVGPELDLHHYKPSEIRQVLDSYLRAASEHHLLELRVIHGKGRGIQRETVLHLLGKHPLVSRYFDAPFWLGGRGATIVTLKKY